VSFFGHLYKSIHFIDELHVGAVYTSPVGCCLSSANVFLLFSILLLQTPLAREALHYRKHMQAKKIHQKYGIWRDEGKIRGKTEERQNII